MILIDEIYKAVKEQLSDGLLNEIIDNSLVSAGESQTVSDWRLENYAQLRSWSYPEYTEFLDAQVKINSGDIILQGEGKYQLDYYFANCLNAKIKFPKSLG
jgi:hypothetical protein